MTDDKSKPAAQPLDLRNVPTIRRVPTYRVPGQDGLAQLVDQDDDDGVETYRWGDVRLECAKCGKWTHHDVYLDVGGIIAINAKCYATCRDCGAEQAGAINSGIGQITRRNLDRSVRRAAAPRADLRRTRRQLARESRRRNR